jgi:hypothetical protein
VKCAFVPLIRFLQHPYEPSEGELLVSTTVEFPTARRTPTGADLGRVPARTTMVVRCCGRGARGPHSTRRPDQRVRGGGRPPSSPPSPPAGRLCLRIRLVPMLGRDRTRAFDGLRDVVCRPGQDSAEAWSEEVSTGNNVAALASVSNPEPVALDPVVDLFTE